jgi:hypothetical protein
MKKDSYGIIWEAKDFKKHGFIATYAIGGCRCKKCTNRWDHWDPSVYGIAYSK